MIAHFKGMQRFILKIVFLGLFQGAAPIVVVGEVNFVRGGRVLGLFILFLAVLRGLGPIFGGCGGSQVVRWALGPLAAQGQQQENRKEEGGPRPRYCSAQNGPSFKSL